MKRPSRIETPAKLINWNDVPSLRIKGAEWKQFAKVARFSYHDKQVVPAKCSIAKILLAHLLLKDAGDR